jgi:hypothetical protein
MQQSSRARRSRPAARSGVGISFGGPLFAGAFLASLALGACQKEAEKEPAKPAASAGGDTAKAAAAKPAAKPQSPKPALKKLEWDDPKQWKRVPPSSSMRVASYHIPPVGGDKEIAELNVFVLGGDIESNIQRWIDEFSKFDPKTLSRTDRVVNDMTEAVVEIPNGTFSGGMNSDSASENFGLLGGIVVTPEDAKYFFKLTGPAATVKGAREAFYGLLDSVRLEGGTAAPASAKTVKTVGGPAAPTSTAAAPPAATPPAAAAPAAPAEKAAPPAAKH